MRSLKSITELAQEGQGSALPASTPAQKLERARERVKSALHAAEEGDLHPATFDEIAQPLVLALRELEELTSSVAGLGWARGMHAI